MRRASEIAGGLRFEQRRRILSARSVGSMTARRILRQGSMQDTNWRTEPLDFGSIRTPHSMDYGINNDNLVRTARV